MVMNSEILSSHITEKEPNVPVIHAHSAPIFNKLKE